MSYEPAPEDYAVKFDPKCTNCHKIPYAYLKPEAIQLLRMFGWRESNDFAVMVQRCLNCVADNPTPTVAEASPQVAGVLGVEFARTKYGGMRRFRIDRREDPTGVSGTGCVAQGIVFSDGTTVVRWLGNWPTTTLHPSIESVEHIHLHEGRSTLRWEDPICSRCGTEIDRLHGVWCDACGAQNAASLETRREKP